MAIEDKAREKSLAYDTKYAEDGVLEDMLSRPQDFREGAIAEIIDLLRKKAYRDGYIDSAKEIEKQTWKMANCLNCDFWKDKKYNVCREIKKLGKTCCTFWKLKEG